MQKNGFTLSEILVVMILLVILTGVVVLKFIDLSARARTSTAVATAGVIQSGIYLYQTRALAAGQPYPACPAELDSGILGAASAGNPLFGTVINNPLIANWSKITSYIYMPALKVSTFYIYDKDTCLFTPFQNVVGADGFVSDGVSANFGTSSQNAYQSTNPGQNLYSATGTAWGSNGTGTFTSWANEQLIYTIGFVETGNYTVTAYAINNAQANGQGAVQPRDNTWGLPPGYTNFNVQVYYDGALQGTMAIPASDNATMSSSFNLAIGSGVHTIGLKWTNDAYNPGAHQDANIQYQQIQIQKQ